MGLKEQLTSIYRGSSSVLDYLGTKDELALVDALIPNDYLVIHTLNDISGKFKDISITIHARDSIISFEELLDKLIEYESFLERQKSFQQIPFYHQQHTF